MHTSQVEQENLATVRRGYEAFNAGDMGTLAAVFRDDVEWYGSDLGALRGTRRGKGDLFTLFGELQQETNGTFRSIGTAYAAAGDQVFVRAITTGVRNGKQLDTEDVLVFGLSGGLVTRVDVFPHDQKTYDAFFA